MEIKNWERLDEKVVYDGYRKMKQKFFRMPNGDIENYDITSGKNYVAIVALTLEKNIILTRQFRPGTEEIFDEIPSGLIDDNESPLNAAQRELLEETGYEGDFAFVGSAPLSAYTDFYGYCYVATDSKKIKDPQYERTEYLETIIKSLKEFRRELKAGRMINGHLAYMGLDFLGLLHDYSK